MAKEKVKLDYSSLDAYKKSQEVLVEKTKKEMAAAGIPTADEKQEQKKLEVTEVTETEEVKPEAPAVPETQEQPDSQTKAEEAKKKLEDYLQSEERKQSAKERAEKQRQDMIAQQLLYGLDGQVPAMEPDKQEEALRAELQHWEETAKKEKEENTLAQDLAVIAEMSEEDKTALNNYVLNKQSAFISSLSPFATGLPADYESNPLIEKYGRERLDQLAESYKKNQNREKLAAAEQKGREHADKNLLSNIFANVGSVGANLADTLLSPMGRISEMAIPSTGRYTGLRENAGDAARMYAQGVRGQTAENIEGDVYDENGQLVQDGGKLRQIGSLAYQGGMSLADSMARGIVGGSPTVGAGLAALGSFNATLADASAKGASTGEAVALATATAGIEALTEKLPLDNLLDIAKGGAGTGFILNTLKQIGIEIGEEEASFIGTTLAEMAILKEKSSYNQDIAKQVAMGVPYEQAKAAADKALLDEAANIAVTSGFSGLFGGMVAGATNKVSNYITNRTQTAQQTETTQQEQTPAQTEQTVQEAPEQPQTIQKLQTAPAAEKPAAPNTIDVLTETITGKPKTAAQTSTQQVDTQNQSAESGQIKGTGAAEQNFSGKPAYNATLSAENAQVDRATDVRPMELPRQDINGGNISAVTGNVYGSQNTPDDLAAAMEEPVARGDFSYIRISNDQATQRAQQTIENAGSWTEAAKNFRSDVESGNAGAELSARGALLLNHAAEVYEQAKASGDTQAAQAAKQDWLSTLADVQRLGTNTAQGMQALKIIRNLMPQDKLEFAKAAVRNMARDMKLGNNIQIDDSLLNEYENATTDQQRDEIIEKIQQNVADQIPSTLLDKWNALRYTNMLGNLKTQVRNVLGNVTNSFIYNIKDAAGAGIEKIANKVTRGKVGRTKTAFVSIEMRKACAEYYDQVKNLISNGGKYGENNSASGDFAQGVMDKRGIFVSDNKVLNAIMKPMEAYRKGTQWAMNNEKFGDAAFGRAAFTRAMAGYLQANGVKPGSDLSKVDSALIDKAMVHAVKEAQEATFHDNSALANVMSKLKKNTGFVGEALMPFTKTPANVLTRAEEFSPLGIINTAVLAAQKAAGNTKMADGTGKAAQWAQAGQDITGTDIVNSLAKTLTGAGIFALGAALHGSGLLNGGPDEDEEKAAYDKLNGVQDYSLNVTIDGKQYTYTLDWLTPVAMPMFMGAQFMKLAEEKDLTFADLEKVFTSIADPMLQMSMMQGVNDSLNNIQNAENNLGQFFINAAVNYLTQGLTNTLLGQIEKSTEGERQTTYVDPESNVPQWMQRALGKASQKTPGWDYQQTEYINAKGETEKQPTDLGGILYNMLSPGYAKEVKSDTVSEELYRLDREDIEGNVFPDSPSKQITWTDKRGDVHEDYNLSEEEYATLAKTEGKTAERIKEKVFETDAYKTMTKQQKADIIGIIDDYAREAGRTAALPDYDGMADWMKDITEENEVKTIIGKAIEKGFDSAFADIVDDWNRGNDTAGSIEALDQAYKNYKAMPEADRLKLVQNDESRVGDYIRARNMGVDAETFADLYKKYRDIDNTNGGVSEKAQKWSYALEKAVDTGTITERQKDMMRKNMEFRYSFAADTAKFDTMIEAGIPTDRADNVIKTLSKTIGTGSNGNVRDIDTRQAIANISGLSDREIDEIMKCYMGDYDPKAESKEYTELKYNYIRYAMGLSPEEYAETYRAHLDNSRKADKIKAIMAMGYDKKTATELYNIYSSNNKGKSAYMGYYDRNN